jgi:phosphoglycolate phosphatase-like HAD superfamily hydrolase
MREPIEHIIWDWNGTLFGDSLALIDATIEAFARVGLPPVTRGDYQRHHTQPIHRFYTRLAGRDLDATEQDQLAFQFQQAYLRLRGRIQLTPDATTALGQWRDAGRGQSLLSMYAHEELLPLVHQFGIDGYFARVDGLIGRHTDGKTPHLERHLAQLGVPRDRVAVVGDSADDAVAARACGVQCVLYHAGHRALHHRDHFAGLDVLIVDSLVAAVDHLAAGQTV